MVLLKSSKFSTVLLKIVTSTFHYGSIKMKLESLGGSLSSISTFHYGSIKIHNIIIKIKKLNLSTFHYGSIKICLNVRVSSAHI